MKKLIIFLLLISFLSACESAREGFSLKKNENDEFLVEKKNPLVMPPDYDVLPNPDDFQSNKKNDAKEEFENIINLSKNDEKSISFENKQKKTSLQKSIIEKIN